MTPNHFRQDFEEAAQVLNAYLSNPHNFELLEMAGNLIVSALKSEKKIIACGNGGSMSDAMHFAEELTGRFRNERPSIAAIAISDPAHITCVANDYGFDHIFSRFVEGIGNSGDILFAISTSGNSANVVNAANAAHNKGMQVIALTGKDGGKLARIANVELRAPQSKFSDRTQEIHIKMIHSLIRYIEAEMYIK